MRLLRTLEREGACSLEHLARLTCWPKSSVARLLRTLEQSDMIFRDDADKRYRCRVRLVPIADAHPTLRQHTQREMAGLCHNCRQTIELYRFDHSALLMIDRCEPEDVPVRVVARVGFRRAVDEADALTQIALAFGLPEKHWPESPLWAWSNGVKQPVPLHRLRELAAAAREHRVAGDLDINCNGVRRYAAPLLNNAGALLGILAVAQSFRPGQTGPDASLTQAVHATAENITTFIVSSNVSTLE